MNGTEGLLEELRAVYAMPMILRKRLGRGKKKRRTGTHPSHWRLLTEELNEEAEMMRWSRAMIPPAVTRSMMTVLSARKGMSGSP